METTFDSIIDNYNQKNEFITKIWVWIAIISIFGIVIIAQPSNKNSESTGQNIAITETINFPIIDIDIPARSFTIVFILILSGLVIRWVEAFQRSFKFRQNIIEPLLLKEEIHVDSIPVNSRNLLDGIVYSTTTSVWGLIPDLKNNKRKRLYRLLRKLIYISLKIVVLIVHFILPALTIFYAAFIKLDSSTVIYLRIPTIAVAIVSILAILFTMLTEIRYISIAWKSQLNLKKA